MNKLRKKSILLIFFILSLLVSQKSLTDGPRNNQISEKINYPKKKKNITKKRKSALEKRSLKRRSRKSKYNYNYRRKKFRGTTRILTFAQIPQIAQELIKKQETIDSSRGKNKEEILAESMQRLQEINKEIDNNESGNGIKIGDYIIPTKITQDTFKKTIAPHITLLVELALIRSLIELDNKIQPHVFTADAKQTEIKNNITEFQNSVGETATYNELASIDPTELNELILKLIAIYNTEKNKEKNATKKAGYVEKLKNYFKPGETKYITQQVDAGLEKAKKAFDIFHGASDASLSSETLKSSMISNIIYSIGIKKANIFETLDTAFISNMTTAISIKSSPKKDIMDNEAERKRANFKEYSKAYTKLVGTSSYPIRKIQGFYSRAKQFITAAENRGLLKTAAAAVAATVIGGVLVKDIYDTKKFLGEKGTWQEAVALGARHTAGRPVNLAKSAWESAKETGQKFREWQRRDREEEAEFENRPISHEEYYDEESKIGRAKKEREEEEEAMRYWLGKASNEGSGSETRKAFAKQNEAYKEYHPSLMDRARKKIADFASKFSKSGMTSEKEGLINKAEEPIKAKEKKDEENKKYQEEMLLNKLAVEKHQEKNNKNDQNDQNDQNNQNDQNK